MAYAALEDVVALFPHFADLGQTTEPSRQAAADMVTHIDNEVNVALAGANYTTPVTAPQFFLDWLKVVVGYGAAAAILKAMFPAATGPGENPAFAFWESRYKSAVRGIQDGSLVPPDVASAGAFTAPSTYLTRNPDTEEDLGDIANPELEVGTQW